MHPLVKLFFNNSSLRGVGKIVRYKGGLRFVWISYVMSMLFLMIYAVAMLIKEYNNSVTSLMTRVIFDIPLEFPAITICYYKPFSWRAESLWKSKKIQTPDEFNLNIRNTSIWFFENGYLHMASQIFDYDQIRLYYQNLEAKEAEKISYTEEDIFLFCVVFYTRSQYRKGTLQQCKLKVRKISMAEYFNCFTVQAMDESISRQMVSLTLVLKFNTSASSNYTENAFLQNVFEQSHGARIQIHESNTLPKMNAADTISISTGTLAEINYSVAQREEVPESGEHCSLNSDEINDMDMSYQYSHDACVESEMNKYYLSHCNCMMAIPPRPQMPTKEFPYCGSFDFKNISGMLFRFKCLGRLQTPANADGAVSRKQIIRQEVCKRPCSEFNYGLHLSTSKWTPDLKKMKQAMKLANAWDVIKSSDSGDSRSKKVAASNDIFSYLNSDSRNSEKSFPSLQSEKESPFSCIRLQRINFDLVHSKDNLILSFNGFISRLGGLCSLTLGLTCIFFVEIIEYIYLAISAIFCQNKKSSDKNRKPLESSFNSNNLLLSSSVPESDIQVQKEEFV